MYGHLCFTFSRIKASIWPGDADVELEEEADVAMEKRLQPLKTDWTLLRRNISEKTRVQKRKGIHQRLGSVRSGLFQI